MTPTIAGLTARQKNIADLLWSCSTEDQMTALIRSLPTVADQRDALSLSRIMILEVAESEGWLDRYSEAAKEIIDRVR
jgi:hypothetical protein